MPIQVGVTTPLTNPDSENAGNPEIGVSLHGLRELWQVLLPRFDQAFAVDAVDDGGISQGDPRDRWRGENRTLNPAIGKLLDGLAISSCIVIISGTDDVTTGRPQPLIGKKASSTGR